MHDTARCLGYPSDSTRAARERARETTCGRPLRRAGQARLGWTPPSLASAASPFAPVAQLSPQWLDSPLPWLFSRPRLNTLSPGRCRRIATSQWPWAYSLGCSPACQIKLDRIATVVAIGVQWGGLGLARFAGGLPMRRVLSLTWPASAVSH